jgi:hypothetical protein
MYLSSKHAEMHSNTLLLPFYWRKMPVFDTSLWHFTKNISLRRHVIVVVICFLVHLNIFLASTLNGGGGRLYPYMPEWGRGRLHLYPVLSCDQSVMQLQIPCRIRRIGRCSLQMEIHLASSTLKMIALNLLFKVVRFWWNSFNLNKPKYCVFPGFQ